MKPQTSKNLRSAFEGNAEDSISADIANLLDQHRLAGPFLSAPHEHFRCSPIGTVTRPRQPNKRRLINHLSWPRNDSVNDGIPDSESHIEYERFGSAVAAI
jgi:hypothetical protein